MAVRTDRPVALTIAGSDSSGGAGVAADLKTFESCGVWGALALTAVTAQNTTGIQRSVALDAEVVVAQITSVANDLVVKSVKTGMLATAEIVRAVTSALGSHRLGPLVVDPVLASGHGESLLAGDGLVALRDGLLPLATVVTPNLPEAAALSGVAVDDRHGMVEAAGIIASRGPHVVLVTGGHLAERSTSPDLLWNAGNVLWLDGPRLAAPHTHGSGCVLSAAIAAALARGQGPEEACIAAKAFVTRAIQAGAALGRGTGPVDPGWRGGAGRDPGDQPVSERPW